MRPVTLLREGRQVWPDVPARLVTTTAPWRWAPGWTHTTRKRAARVQAFMDWAHALLLRRLGPQLETR